jgi:predicted ester cyclase
MSVLDDNKATARRFLDLVSADDVDELVRMITPTWTMHGGPPQLPAGEAGMRQLFATFGRVVQQWRIEDVIAEGDRVVVRAVNTVDQDSFFGVPSLGRLQMFTAVFIHRLVDGLIDETWRAADDLGRVLQLGGRIESEPAAS